jgi:hypothetical protein
VGRGSSRIPSVFIPFAMPRTSLIGLNEVHYAIFLDQSQLLAGVKVQLGPDVLGDDDLEL